MMTPREKRIFKLTEKLQSELLLCAMALRDAACTCEKGPHLPSCEGLKDAKRYFRTIDKTAISMRKFEGI